MLSNLEWCRWEMVRQNETLSACEAIWAEDLPAYVTLEIKTKGGLWMKWMFEVDWTRGAEPGAPMTAPGVPGGAAAAGGAVPVLSDLPVVGSQFRNGNNSRNSGGNNSNGTNNATPRGGPTAVPGTRGGGK